MFKVGESLPGEAKHILKSLGVFEVVNNDAMQGIDIRMISLRNNSQILTITFGL